MEKPQNYGRQRLTRIIFVQPHLRFGGAERQTVLVANHLAAMGHEIHVVLHCAAGGLTSELSSAVRVHDLRLESHIGSAVIARRLYGVLKSIPASLVIVKLWSSILASALIDGNRGVRHHVFNYCEDLDPTDHAKYIRFGAVKQWLIGRIFNRRANLSANTYTVAKSMVSVYGLKCMPVVIPSTVDVGLVNSLAVQTPSEFGPGTHILSVGSLIRRKGLDITLAALLEINRPLTWHILGDGPLNDNFRQFRDERGLLTIRLHEGTTNPYRFMAAADILVHSARSEAWGIVLLESIALGTPVLAADAIGPEEMHSVLGTNERIMRTYPVGDSRILSQVLEEMLNTKAPSLLEMQTYISRFSVEHAARSWLLRAEELLR